MKKNVSKNAVVFWLRTSINNSSDGDCTMMKLRLMRSLVLNPLYSLEEPHSLVNNEGWNTGIPDQVCLILPSDVTHSWMDTFSIGPVVAAQQVV